MSLACKSSLCINNIALCYTCCSHLLAVWRISKTLLPKRFIAHTDYVFCPENGIRPVFVAFDCDTSQYTRFLARLDA